MQMTLRWYEDENNPIDLQYIKQIPGVTGIVSEIREPVGAEWPMDKILNLKKTVESYGLHLEVIESVKVHEDIKLGLSTRDEYIEIFKQNIRNLSKIGIKAICYDFMPVFDWTRTQTDKELPDGSKTLVYYKQDLEKVDPLKNGFALEDWEVFYTPEEMKRLFKLYKDVDEEKLWDNLEYFIKAIIPVAEECDIKMGMHPDDPPWSIFGLPRIITGEKNIDRFLKIVDSEYNSLTLCSGSLGCSADNDVPALVRKYSEQKRICFGHIRNVKLLDDGSFEESAHFSECGSLDVVQIVKSYYETGFEGYIRPDHGRMIWGETGIAGYGLYDRALGAMYLSGIWETLKKT